MHGFFSLKTNSRIEVCGSFERSEGQIIFTAGVWWSLYISQPMSYTVSAGQTPVRCLLSNYSDGGIKHGKKGVPLHSRRGRNVFRSLGYR